MDIGAKTAGVDAFAQAEAIEQSNLEQMERIEFLNDFTIDQYAINDHRPTSDGGITFAQEPALEYIASHTDLADAFGADASAGRSHFNAFALDEARSITFSAEDYKAANADLADLSDTEAAAHYITTGRFEDRPTE